MRETFLMILLLALSGGAAADWIKIGTGLGSGGFDIYADSTTAVRARDTAKMWSLSNFKIEQTRSSGFRFLSSKSYDEYDCKIGRLRVLSLVTYSGNMASGVSMDTGIAARDWKPITPGSVEDTSWKLACARL